MKPNHPFGAHGRLRRRGVLTQELGRQRGRRCFWQGAAVQRYFPPSVAHLRSQVVAMQLEKAIADDQPQPEKERVGWLAQVFAEPADDLDISLLDHVRCVDPRLQTAIKPQLYHPPQARPMQTK